MKTCIYNDGFNLDYGCIKGTPNQWLDLGKLYETLLPRNEIICIKYFTAKISTRGSSPNAPANQDTYFRALKTVPNVGGQSISPDFDGCQWQLSQASGLVNNKTAATPKRIIGIT